MDSGPSCLHRLCPAVGCTLVVPEEFVEKYCCEKLTAYRSFHLESFVSQNKVSAYVIHVVFLWCDCEVFCCLLFVVCCLLCGRKVRGRWAVESVTVSVLETERISISATNIRISVAFSDGWFYRSPEHPSFPISSFLHSSFFRSFFHSFFLMFKAVSVVNDCTRKVHRGKPLYYTSSILFSFLFLYSIVPYFVFDFVLFYHLLFYSTWISKNQTTTKSVLSVLCCLGCCVFNELFEPWTVLLSCHQTMGPFDCAWI